MKVMKVPQFNMKLKYLALLLIVVVFISGCVQQTTTHSGTDQEQTTGGNEDQSAVAGDPETWSGTITGSYILSEDDPDSLTSCYPGQPVINIHVIFKVPHSLIYALKNPNILWLRSTEATSSSEVTLSKNSVNPGCKLYGGTSGSIPVQVDIQSSGTQFHISSINKDNLAAGRFELWDYGYGPSDPGRKTYEGYFISSETDIAITSVSDSAVSGTWNLSPSRNGTFIFTKQAQSR